MRPHGFVASDASRSITRRSKKPLNLRFQVAFNFVPYLSQPNPAAVASVRPAFRLGDGRRHSGLKNLLNFAAGSWLVPCAFKLQQSGCVACRLLGSRRNQAAPTDRKRELRLYLGVRGQSHDDHEFCDIPPRVLRRLFVSRTDRAGDVARAGAARNCALEDDLSAPEFRNSRRDRRDGARA